MPMFFSPGQGAAAPAAPRVEESRPTIFYLPDKQGNLQPVLDFRFEEFEELYKLKHGLERRVEPPRYVIERMAIAGHAADGRAELNVEFQITLRDDQWTRVPLRLDRALLRGEVKYKGDGRQFISCEADDGGYVLWISGHAGSPHTIAFAAIVPLEPAGGETRLRLSMPRATASELTLTVPVAGAIGAVSEGAALLSTRPADGGATEFVVARSTGEFQLAWHGPDANGADVPAVLEAVGTILARFDGRGVYSEAALSVRSLGAAFDRFVVLLPPGAELAALPVAAAGYSVAPAAADGRDGDPRKAVEVRLAKKTVGPVEVRIAARREGEAPGDDSWLELAGFEVVGAVRQWGTIAVAADGRRRVLWGECRRTSQIEQLPDGLRGENVLAGFEYHGQPFSLTVRPAPRKTRIAVEPEYVLLVDPWRVRLEAKLSYSIRGGEVSQLKVGLPGWRLIEAGPDRLVTPEGIAIEEGAATIPLARPTSGEIELRISAERSVDAASGELSIPLPALEADAIRPASLTVLPAGNVELIPDETRLADLALRAGPPSMNLDESGRQPLDYRATGDRPVFAAALRVLKRQISVAVAGHVSLADGTASVRQKFSYTIRHEPAGRLTLNIPRKLTAPGRMLIVCDGVPLAPSAADRDPVGGDPLEAVPVGVALSEPRIGECELLLSYTVAVEEPSADRPAVVAIPLAMPADGDLTGNELIVKTLRNIDPRLLNEGWSESPGNGLQTGLRLTAAARRYSLDLDLHLRGGAAGGALVVDRAWTQTRFDAGWRQDRAVFRLATDLPEIEAVLPGGADVEQASVLVDGQPVKPRRMGENRLSIPLGERGSTRRATIELRCHYPAARPPRGAMDVKLPRLAGKTWMRRAYWQLVLPPNEHLISAPSGWTGEYVWKFNGTFWGREQSINQAELESWAGATADTPNFGRANRYLFSAIGEPSPTKVRTAGRTWIVLWSSAAALIAGLLLIHVPALRRPQVLFAGGVALLAAGLIAPRPALLAAQAAAIGLALAMLAGLLQRGLVGTRAASAKKDFSSSRIDLGSSRIATPAQGEIPSTRPIQPIAPPAPENSER